MNDSSYSSESDDSVLAMQLVTASVVSRAMKTAIELNILELMKKAAGSVSASELAALIRASNPEAHLMIDRILRLLAANNILECTLINRHDCGGGVDRRYSLAPVCKLFTNNDNGVSLAPLLHFNQDKVSAEAFYHLKDAIVEGGVPFDRAHGMSAFEYPATDSRFNKVFNQAMSEQSTMFMLEILEKYNGFEGVESLVDVGGGIGTSLKMILFKYPSIKAINFDLPHVIQHAPSHPGIKHISGDMFVSIPKGSDAIFMKWICHDWSDAHCLKLLKNCNEALLDNGKLIIADVILSEIPNKDPLTSVGLAVDLLMLTYNTGGKERTEAEFHALVKASGFKHFRKVCCAFSTWIMELYK